MGFRFRRSLKILPGVRLNFGKKGFSSVSVGKRGATYTVGKRGNYANVGIPGTGLSYRERLDKKKRQSKKRGPSFSRREDRSRIDPEGSGSDLLIGCFAIIGVITVLVVFVGCCLGLVG